MKIYEHTVVLALHPARDGRYRFRFFESNFSCEQIEAAHQKGESIVGISLKTFDWIDDEINFTKEQIAALRACKGWSDKKILGEDWVPTYVLNEDSYTNLWLFIASVGDPTLRYRPMKDKNKPIIYI